MCAISGDNYFLKRASELTTLQVERLLYLGLPYKIIVYHTQNNENGGVDYCCVCKYGQDCNCIKDDKSCHRVISKSIVDEFYQKV